MLTTTIAHFYHRILKFWSVLFAREPQIAEQGYREGATVLCGAKYQQKYTRSPPKDSVHYHEFCFFVCVWGGGEWRGRPGGGRGGLPARYPLAVIVCISLSLHRQLSEEKRSNPTSHEAL